MNDQNIGRRRRRTFDPAFKAEVVAACQHPGVSVAAVALSHGLNANLLRRWVTEHERYGHHPLTEEDRQEGSAALSVPTPQAAPPFISVPFSPPSPPVSNDESIRLELKRGASTVSVSWPVSAAAQCADFLREWLR